MGKSLFAQYNLPVSKGKVIFNASDAVDACNEIGGSKWVVKAQVHAGGRGKAGGVELIDSEESATEFAEKWLNFVPCVFVAYYMTGCLKQEESVNCYHKTSE